MNWDKLCTEKTTLHTERTVEAGYPTATTANVVYQVATKFMWESAHYSMCLKMSERLAHDIPLELRGPEYSGDIR